MTSIDDRQSNGIDRSFSTDRARVWLPTLGLRVSERRLLLLFGDVFLLFLSLTLSVMLRTDYIRNPLDLWFNIKWYVTLALLWGLMATIFQVYDLARAADPGYGVLTTATASGLTGLIYLAIPWLTPPIENRSQGFLFVILSTLLVGAWRLLYARLFVQPAFQHRTLVVGAGQSGRILAEILMGSDKSRNGSPFRGTGYEIVGYIDDDPAKQQFSIEEIPVLGTSESLLGMVKTHDVDEVIVAISNTQEMCPELFEAILDCREIGVPIGTMTTVYERVLGRVAYEHASRNVALATGQNEGPFLRLYSFAKRIVDIIGALIALAGLVILIPFVILGNRLSSPGPLFFRQIRVGRGGKPYQLIKFRSMIPEAEQESGAIWASIKDKRVTKVGRWLRLTHLDELPQVINVLRGEMSLVGPRPERPEFVDKLSQTIPFYRARHSMKPGITGWAQIHQNYGDSEEGAREKLEYDLYYIKQASPTLDTLIMLRTVSKVLTFRGR